MRVHRVITAAPRLVVQSALDGIVPADHIAGADFEFDRDSGEICAVTNVPAGYGKVAVLEELEAPLQISPDHTGPSSPTLAVANRAAVPALRLTACSEGGAEAARGRRARPPGARPRR